MTKYRQDNDDNLLKPAWVNPRYADKMPKFMKLFNEGKFKEAFDSVKEK